MSTIFPNPDTILKPNERKQGHLKKFLTSQLRSFAHRRVVLLMCASLFAVLDCLSSKPYAAQSSEGVLRGTVTYFERMALPRSAEVHVALVEVCDHKQQAIVAEQTIATEGRQVPIPFKLIYRLTSIRPDCSYAVRAEIVMFGEVWFITRRPVPVLTHRNPRAVRIIVSRSS